MKKDFELKLSKLFDYQKYEDNSKLKQTINDIMRDSLVVSDFELANATGGSISSESAQNIFYKGRHVYVAGIYNNDEAECTGICLYNSDNSLLSEVEVTFCNSKLTIFVDYKLCTFKN